VFYRHVLIEKNPKGRANFSLNDHHSPPVQDLRRKIRIQKFTIVFLRFFLENGKSDF
jgi:hypothetical protein